MFLTVRLKNLCNRNAMKDLTGFLGLSSKGNVRAIPLIIMITFTLSITVLTSYTVLDTIQDNTSDNQIDQETLSSAKSALTVFDYGIVAINATFYIASFIFVYQIPSNPIYTFPALLFGGIAVWFSAEISNVYGLFARAGPMTDAANRFDTLYLYFSNQAEIVAVLTVLVVIGLYAKTRSGQEVSV